MDKQQTFYGSGMKKQRKILRAEVFLAEMNKVIPWDDLISTIKPYYKKKTGRQPWDIGLMLRLHFLQIWYNLSDPALEEAVYDRLTFQNFLGFDCFGGDVPDESSICRFRHLLEQHNLSEKIFASVNNYLDKKGLVMKQGTIVDASLLSAPISKKNKKKARDPEMSSTKKNNKWHFGAKLHIGVQHQGKPLIHSLEVTTAKESDKNHMTKLFHGEEKAIFGDSGYTHQEEKRGARHEGLYYGISDRGAHMHPLSASQKKRNRKLSSIRAKVEHPFAVIKNLWGQGRLKYKGLFKNKCRMQVTAALVNIFYCRKALGLVEAS